MVYYSFKICSVAVLDHEENMKVVSEDNRIYISDVVKYDITSTKYIF